MKPIKCIRVKQAAHFPDHMIARLKSTTQLIHFHRAYENLIHLKINLQSQIRSILVSTKVCFINFCFWIGYFAAQVASSFLFFLAFNETKPAKHLINGPVQVNRQRKSAIISKFIQMIITKICNSKRMCDGTTRLIRMVRLFPNHHHGLKQPCTPSRHLCRRKNNFRILSFDHGSRHR